MTTFKEPVDFRDGVPYSMRFQDCYYSADGGLHESRHVFLAGNGLPGRFLDGFRIAELGFGTGLNMLAALDAWIESGTEGSLHYTGFEAFPVTTAVMRQSLEHFPRIHPYVDCLCMVWKSGARTFRILNLTAEVIIGDARDTLPKWNGHADAWFLDGFSPSKNSELWDPALLKQVANRTVPGGTFATYSAAGAVRRNLRNAGFDVKRFPGFGRKRHMLAGQSKRSGLPGQER